MIDKSMASCQSEEDVKTVLIKELKLDEPKLGSIDLRTQKVWFETKFKGMAMKNVANTFCQLFAYVAKARLEGEELPIYLAIADETAMAMLEYKDVEYLFDNHKYDFNYTPSNPPKSIIEQCQEIINLKIRHYNYSDGELINDFKTIKENGFLAKIEITKYNLMAVFARWIELIGRELISDVNGSKVDESDFTSLFYSDIFYDAETEDTLEEYHQLAFRKERPIFLSKQGTISLASHEGYFKFWQKYIRPPKDEHKNSILERRDMIIPVDYRKFTGAFYTPIKGVELCYSYLAKAYGENWQDEYYVWDMASGVGNLLSLHNNPRNCFMSTLDNDDIKVINATKTCLGAEVFQYDYLNDDVGEQGLDYSLSGKMPKELRRIIKEESHKLIVLINPPYGEASDSIAKGANKVDVSNTNVNRYLGTTSNELFIQFITRMHHELGQAKLAMFSKLKYLNAPKSANFRELFRGQFETGFILHSKLFESKGNFPIGFLMWQLGANEAFKQVKLDVYNDDYYKIGTKTFIPYQPKELLTNWLERPKRNNTPVIALSNAITPFMGQFKQKYWSDGAIGYLVADSNDLQHSSRKTAIISGITGSHVGGFYLNKENLAQACVIFTVRRVIKPTWLNDRDQFLIPHTQPSPEFYNDCLIYTLFSNSNLSASADGLAYQGQDYSIVNHFIPFTEAELNAPKRFASSFMLDYIKQHNLTFSSEAVAVLNQAKYLWQSYFKEEFEYKVRDELKLGRSDVGWYQIRKALETKKSPRSYKLDFDSFASLYDKLSQKLIPDVYNYGFLLSEE